MIQIRKAESKDDLLQIINLQKRNLQTSLSHFEIEKEGFVTCIHDVSLLEKMNHPFQHILAVNENDEVVGYCLVMLPKWRNELDVLKSMFDTIEASIFINEMIKEEEYIVVGQVCVGKNYRKQGVFRKMYHYYKEAYARNFKYCITEIAVSNKRSFNAHQSIGFQLLKRYLSDDGKEWDLIIWDWIC